MNLAVTLSGFTLVLIGLAGVAGVIPLSVVNTVNFSNGNASCDVNNACSISYLYTNVNSTQTVTLYERLTNSQGQAVFLNTFSQPASTSTLTPTSKVGTLPSGAYIFSVFATNQWGTVISQTYSYAFNVGKFKLIVYDYNPGVGSVSPSCKSTSPCQYPIGEKVTLTYTPASGYYFGQWCYFGDKGNQGCFPSGTPAGSATYNPKLNMTMDQNYGVSISVAQASPNLNIQYFSVTPVVSITGGCPISPSSQVGVACPRGSILPSDTQRVYSTSSSSYGATSIQFTATPAANMTFANWQVNGRNFTANALTLNYTTLEKIKTASAQLDFQLYTYFKAKQFYQLGVGAYSGITTSPAAKNGGTYYYAAGQQVTVSISSVDNDVCFTGWLVDGNDVGKQDSVTVTMDRYHSVFAQGVGKPAAGCSGASDGDDSSTANVSLPALAFIGAGSAVTIVGVTRKRKPIG